ncbi:sodium-dependent lysophosphatidylcholine symporter 1-like [Glandiceps talaboti]
MGSLFFLPENNVVVAFIFCFLLGTVLSSTHLLPWSMLTDVIDDYIVKTEMRKDAIFYSFYASFMKLSIGIGLGMSTLVLGFAGYETGACLQPDSVAMTMRILVSVVPICLILISLIFLYLYPINESRIKENKAVLAKRREQRTSSNGTFDLTSENSDGIRAPRARVTQTLEG